MEKLKRRGILFVLSSPSGAGKSSIANYILENDKSIGLSVSCTTRNKRKGEVKGRDYQYISISEFNNVLNFLLHSLFSKVNLFLIVSLSKQCVGCPNS